MGVVDAVALFLKREGGRTRRCERQGDGRVVHMFVFLSKLLDGPASPMQAFVNHMLQTQILSLPAIFRDPVDPWSGQASNVDSEANVKAVLAKANAAGLKTGPVKCFYHWQFNWC